MGNQQQIIAQNDVITPKQCCNQMSIYITSGNVDLNQVTCSICFTLFNCPRIMKCKHIFCQECIRTWGKNAPVTCPFCRTQLKKSKGNYGRADKKTQKKLQKLHLKCRSCHWSGSTFQFICDFDRTPFIDEDYIPNQTAVKQEHEACEEMTEKKQKQQVQKQMPTGQKNQKKQIQGSKQKQQEKQVKNIFQALNTPISNYLFLPPDSVPQVQLKFFDHFFLQGDQNQFQ